MTRSLTCSLLLSLSVLSAPARSQTPDVTQLKTKLQQLEQMMQELKQQIADVEAGQKAPGEAFVTPAAPQPAPEPQPQLPAVSVGSLTATREVASENNSTSVARINNEISDPSLRGYFRLPGTGTLIRLGGFIKTDVFVDANQAGSYYGAYVPSSFPSSPQPHTVNATVSMRASRFSVEFLQPVEGGTDSVKGYLEYDFLGNYDRTSLRLRHFYAQYKNLLIGQYWSSFGDPDAFPDTLEFEGPPGMMGLRQPMIRYTIPVGKSNSFGISVEKSGTDTPFSTQYGTPVGSSLRPDLIGFYRYENKHGHLYFAGISRSVGGVVPNSNVPDLRNHADGYGGSLSGVWGSSRDNVVFQFIIGKGISNYYNDNFGLGSDVGGDARGNLVATPTGSGQAGYQHYWTKLVRSTFSYGYLRINNTAEDPGTNYHISHYATGNFIIQPSVHYLFGAEYVYGSLERKDGFKWVAPRIQASFTYYLNKYPKE
ncbi:MAG TPA: DcaP family trimeric outer membrane transporter [Bryobacteraceae bacterium]|nr:DcaP family trimeric outer membrane transporter [Bryobacteraceae bacterium]